MSKRKRLERMNERLAEQAAKWYRSAQWYQRRLRIHLDAGSAGGDAYMVRLIQQRDDARRWAAAWKRAAKVEHHERLGWAKAAAVTICGAADEATDHHQRVAALIQQRDQAQAHSRDCDDQTARDYATIVILRRLLRRWDSHFVTMVRGPICDLQHDTRAVLNGPLADETREALGEVATATLRW